MTHRDGDGAREEPGTDSSRRRFLIGVAATGAVVGAGGLAYAQEGEADFELRGVVGGWMGQSPSSIQGTTNPTLELEAGTDYVLVWENGDGVPHTFEIEDAAGDRLVSTEQMSSQGETQRVEFTASEEMAEYFCSVHPQSMRGQVQVSGTSTATSTPTETATEAETETETETETPADTEFPDGEQFYADLSGDEQVPEPVDSAGTGLATFETGTHGEGPHVHYDLTVRTIENVTQAHVHLGGPDENGPVVAFLLRITDSPDGSGGQPRSASPGSPITQSGNITAGDLLGPLEGEPLSALVEAMNSDGAYVNVHTTANPPGEIRGQVRPGRPPSDGTDGKAKDGDGGGAAGGNGKAKDGTAGNGSDGGGDGSDGGSEDGGSGDGY